MNKLDRYKQAKADADRNRKRIADEELQNTPSGFYLNPTQKAYEVGSPAFAAVTHDMMVEIKSGLLTSVQAHRLAEWILDLVRE